MMKSSWLLLTCAAPLACFAENAEVRAAGTSQIKRDEVVLFYPSYARLLPDRGTWSLAIRGSIFEPETGSLRRGALLAAIRRGLGRSLSPGEVAILDRRLRLFLVDHERGKTIQLRIGSQTYSVGPSGADGQFSGRIELPASAVEKLAAEGSLRDRWLSLVAVTRPGDDRRFLGRVRFVEPAGLSVISDIDDTIKISQVRDRKALVANTFLRPFQPVPGMAELYRGLGPDAAFHYLSASPWQLYEPLADFLREGGFPLGTFHLKPFRLTDASLFDLFGLQEGYKTAVIEELLAAFPGRRFLLVGDTGEQDPEIYGHVARKHPEQVAGIFLRNVTDEAAGSPRLAAALADVPLDRWRLFRQPEELRAAAAELAKKYSRPAE